MARRKRDEFVVVKVVVMLSLFSVLVSSWWRMLEMPSHAGHDDNEVLKVSTIDDTFPWPQEDFRSGLAGVFESGEVYTERVHGKI